MSNVNNDPLSLRGNEKEETGQYHYSSYERLRQEKIKRNESRLRQLGLISYEGTSNNITHTRSSMVGKRKMDSSTTTTEENSLGRRRSSRRRNSNKNKEIDSEIETDQTENQGTETEIDKPFHKKSNKKITPKDIKLNTNKIISLYLGKTFQDTGKASVVNTCAHISMDMMNKSDVTFSRLSGVLEWKNGSFFLWVNFEPKNKSSNSVSNNKKKNNKTPTASSSYVNTFLEGGRKMVWYGGSKMTEKSPVIQRLIATGKKSSVKTTDKKNDTKNGSILLFCRRTQVDESSTTANKKFLPYTCFGRLGYSLHFPETHPLQFHWDLLDYDELIEKVNISLFFTNDE